MEAEIMFNGLPEKALRWVRNRARRIRQLRKQNEAHRELNYIENIINMFLRQLKHPNTTTEEDMSSEALAGQNTPPDGNIIPSDPVTQASLEKNTGRNINTIDHQQHFNPTNSNPSNGSGAQHTNVMDTNIHEKGEQQESASDRKHHHEPELPQPSPSHPINEMQHMQESKANEAANNHQSQKQKEEIRVQSDKLDNIEKKPYQYGFRKKGLNNTFNNRNPNYQNNTNKFGRRFQWNNRNCKQKQSNHNRSRSRGRNNNYNKRSDYTYRSKRYYDQESENYSDTHSSEDFSDYDSSYDSHPSLYSDDYYDSYESYHSSYEDYSDSFPYEA